MSTKKELPDYTWVSSDDKQARVIAKFPHDTVFFPKTPKHPHESVDRPVGFFARLFGGAK